MADGAGRPLDERLAEEGRARPAPVDPVLVAAALGDRSDPDTFLYGRRVCETIAMLAECCQQSRREDWPSAGEIVEEFEIGKRFAASGDVGVEASNAGRQRAELRDQRRNHGERRLDDRW